LNWKNASNLYWTGNRLSSIEIDGLDEALAFSYNADGVRNGKTYWDKNGIPTYHRYTVDGNRIISETVSGADNYTLYYLYGANGGIEGFIYNNTYYYFQKNIQGDIIRICNCLGETVVEYGYDVWGTVTSVTGDLASTIGQINPFRYRGYYYDAETGWYYLNARYYDPNVGRFLSPDTILGANGGLQGYNLFAYCNNNPVMFVDPSGNIANFIYKMFEKVNKLLSWKKTFNLINKMISETDLSKMGGSYDRVKISKSDKTVGEYDNIADDIVTYGITTALAAYNPIFTLLDILLLFTPDERIPLGEYQQYTLTFYKDKTFNYRYYDGTYRSWRTKEVTVTDYVMVTYIYGPGDANLLIQTDYYYYYDAERIYPYIVDPGKRR